MALTLKVKDESDLDIISCDLISIDATIINSDSERMCSFGVLNENSFDIILLTNKLNETVKVFANDTIITEGTLIRASESIINDTKTIFSISVLNAVV